MTKHHLFNKIFTTTLLLLLFVGLGTLIYFGFFPKSPDSDGGLELSGKTYVHNDVLVEWQDGITSAQKAEFLNGEPETEYFNRIKALFSSHSEGNAIEFASSNSLKLITTEGEKTCTYTVNENTIIITDSSGETEVLTYENSCLKMVIADGSFTSMYVKVTLVYIKGSITPPTPPTPPTQELDLTGKSFVFSDILVEWADGITGAEKEAILEGSPEEEYFEAVKSSVLFGFDSSGGIEFISKTQVKVYTIDSETTYSYTINENTITLQIEDETIVFTYDNPNLLSINDSEELALYMGIKYTLVYVEGEITPPLQVDVSLTGRKYVYDNITVEWADGLSQAEKEEFLDDKTETDYFNSLKMGALGVIGDGLEFISDTQVQFIDPSFTINENTHPYYAGENTIIILHGTMAQWNGTYNEDSLTIGYYDKWNGVNITFYLVKEETVSPTPPTQELNLTGKSFVFSEVSVEWADGVSETQKVEFLESEGYSPDEEAECFNDMKEMFETFMSDSGVEFETESSLNLISSFLGQIDEETCSYTINGNVISYEDSYGDTYTIIYENSTLLALENYENVLIARAIYIEGEINL